MPGGRNRKSTTDAARCSIAAGPAARIERRCPGPERIARISGRSCSGSCLFSDVTARSFEIIFVDDGSTDETLEHPARNAAMDRRIAAISFSRNFGKEIAIAAGLDHAARAARQSSWTPTCSIRPKRSRTSSRKWREGYKNVFGQRRDRYADSPLRRALDAPVLSISSTCSAKPTCPRAPATSGCWTARRSRRSRACAKRARFSKGLYAWIGFKSIGVPFDVAERAAGTSKFSYRKLTRFALDGLMSFSTMPLRVWTYIGFAISFRRCRSPSISCFRL